MLGDALLTIGENDPEGTSMLTQAVAAYRAALQVYTVAAFPDEFALAQNGVGYALTLIGERQKKVEPFTEAVAALRQAVAAQQDPTQQANLPYINDSLCRALSGVGTYGRDKAAFDEAETVCQGALAAFKAAGNNDNAQETTQNLDNVRKGRKALR